MDEIAIFIERESVRKRLRIEMEGKKKKE